MEDIIFRNYLKYETSKYVHHFQKFQTVRSFGENICDNKLQLHGGKADKKESNFLISVAEFKVKFMLFMKVQK